MLLLRYNSYDESTNEYETGDLANVDVEGSAKKRNRVVTLYTGCGSWYITLDEKDVQKLVKALR